MSDETLDLSVFRDALLTLKEAVNAQAADPANTFIRDATIKRFEYCYEFAAKMITRHLILTEDDPVAVKAMSFQDKIRRAYEIGLIPNSWDTWFHYRDSRNATAHGYSKDRADALVKEIPAFYHEAATLLDNLSAIYETEV